MSRRFPLGFVLGLIVLPAFRMGAQSPAEVTAALAEFKPGVSPEDQLDALRSIATSLDPRIPAACLPLLRSPGDSLQRNAARAIGSRWWQIPQNELATYVRALKANLGTDKGPSLSMTRRGIGLLTRTYDGDMFSRSQSKRWVIYERRGKPCLIDSRNHTEELLGFGLEGNFLPAYGNEPLTPSCHWHPKEDMVALDILIFRRPRLLWVWRAAGGLRSFSVEELRRVLKPAQGELSEYAIFSADFNEWKGRDVEFTVDYILGEGDQEIERSARLRWESGSDTLRILSDQRQE